MSHQRIGEYPITNGHSSGLSHAHVAGSLPRDAVRGKSGLQYQQLLLGGGPSVSRGGIARCNKAGNAPYDLGLSGEGWVVLIWHDNDFELAAALQPLIQGGPGQIAS
jgi:hypothetical protein